MAHTFSKQLVAGTPENVNDVMTDLNEAAADWEQAFSSYKVGINRGGSLVAGSPLGSGVYPLLGRGVTPAGSDFADNAAFFFSPTVLSASPRSVVYRIDTWITTNAVAPGVTFTFGLFHATITPGASGAANVAAPGSQVAGSSSAYSTPGAGVTLGGSSSDFTPGSAGWYTLGYIISGGTAPANCWVQGGATLLYRQV